MKISHLRRLVVVIVCSLLLFSGAAVADANYTVSSGVEYTTDSGLKVTAGTNHTISDDPFVDSESVRLNNVTFSSSGLSNVTVNQFDGSWTNVSGLEINNTVRINASDKQAVRVQDGIDDLHLRSIDTSESDVDLIYSASSTTTLRLESQPSVGLVAVDMETGEQLATTSVGDGGVATFDLPSGDYNVDIRTRPSELQVFYETDPDTLINDSSFNLSVRFFSQSDTNTVIERPVTNGTVSLANIPTDQRFVVTIQSDNNAGLTYRRIIIDSIVKTEQIYLLRDSEPQSQIIFNLDDPTGQFPAEVTQLYVEKPITKDYDLDGEEETRYQTIAGDTFGATGEFSAILQSSARYRLRVETDAGDQSRILGAYSVSGSTTVPIQIQRIKPQSDTDSGASVYGGIGPNGDSLTVRYRDPDSRTSEVRYSVKYPNGSTWISETTRTSTPFSDTYILPAGGNGSDYTVNYEYDRAGETISDSFVASAINEIADRTGIDGGLLSAISIVIILAVIGLVTLVKTELAPFSGTAAASLLTILGFISIPSPILGIAGAVSVLTIFGGRR